MSIQPEGQNTDPATTEDMWVDYSQYAGGQPQIAPSYSRSSGSTISAVSPTFRNYSGTSAPIGTYEKLWGKNGYYMNGPNFDPYNHARTNYNLVQSQVKMWTDLAQRQALEKLAQPTVDRFADLLTKYGHTNSPGVLLSIAQSNLELDSPPVNGLLAVDARASAEAYGAAAPALVSAPSAMPEASWSETFFAPVQFAARNLFAALSMPLEAIQGAQRTAGGELTDENAPWWDMQSGRISGAIAAYGSLLPPLALWADRVRGDSNFVNPWEQTEFGQTLLTAASSGGFDAFTTLQAGLDIERAKKDILQDPAVAALVGQEGGQEEINRLAILYAKQNNYYARPGWFIDETSPVGESSRQETFRAWAIPDPQGNMTSWTLGRGIASKVSGTDMAAYNVMSGLVDAVAAIAMDPLTYAGGVGIPSKVIKGVTSLRGADKALLVGRELQKANEARAAANLNLRAAAEKAGVPLTEAGSYSVEETASMVRTSMQIDLVTEAQKLASVDSDYVTGLARERYRSLANSDRLSRYGSRDEIAAIDPSQIDINKARSIWNLYIDNSFGSSQWPGITKLNRGVYQTKDNRFRIIQKEDSSEWDLLEISFENNQIVSENWAQTYRTRKQALEDLLEEYRVPGGDFNVTGFNNFSKSIANDPESVAIWNTLNTKSFELTNLGYLDSDPAKAAAQFRTILDNQTTRSVQRTSISQTEIDSAIDEIYADPAIDNKINYSGNEVDYIGVVSYDSPAPGVRVIGHTAEQGSKQETLIAWLSPTAPKLVNGSDFVDEASKLQIFNYLRDALPQIDDAVVPFMDDAESFVGQTMNIVATAASPLKGFFELEGATNLTWSGLLNAAARIGIDGWLDDAIRSTDEAFDGITSLSSIQGKGTWFGDNPNIRSYIIDRENLDGAVKVSSSVDRMTGLAEIPVDMILTSSQRWRGKARTIANSMEEYAGGILQTAQRASDSIADRTRELDEMFADPLKALTTTIGYQAGIKYSKASGVSVLSKDVRQFLFGNSPISFYANKALDAIASFIPEADRARAATDPAFAESLLTRAQGELYMVTNGKWDPQTYRELAENAVFGDASKENVLKILAPRLGVDVSPGDVARTTRSVDGDVKKYIRTWRTAYGPVARALGAMPTSRKINFSSSEETADAILQYGRYSKIPEDVLAEQIGKVISAHGTMRSVGVNRNAIVDTFKIIGKKLVEELETDEFIFKGKTGGKRKQDLINAMQRSVIVFFNGYVKGSSNDPNEIADITKPAVAFDGSVSKFLTEDGTFIGGPDVNIDTELAQGFVTLPNVDEWNKALNRFTRAMSRFKPVESTYDLAKTFFDNFFRTSLLVFRLSYIFRNIAEMQVRMYLNGHKSVFSDPATMVGMVIGNSMYATKLEKYAKKYDAAAQELRDAGKEVNESAIRAIAGEPPAQSRLIELFKAYNQTVLDTSFEVGLDRELAVANHVEDYWALLREANSLTDPRIYNSAVMQKWIHIQYNSPDFTKGWAHELIMLQRSKIAQLVLSGPVTGSIDSTGARSFEQMTVDALMNSPDYEPLRELMIGADSKFETIFKDPVATMEYLFTNKNSVFNRINNYTAGDPALMSFLRTGIMKYGDNETLNLRAIPNANDRMNDFAYVLDKHYKNSFWENHFQQNSVSVPWIEGIDKRPGFKLFNDFFDFANKIERLTSVGPEFRLAYWDRIAELAPALRVDDVERARKAAKTTLGPINRMLPDGKEVNIGKTHPAFAALDKASKENTGGLLTLDDLHGMAMRYASDHVKELFYDAARRNKTWAALRIIFPFGQAWGNTVSVWAELGAKKPIQVYKAQKALNALIEDGSSAIYEAGEGTILYGDYAPGSAPWEQDVNGGFFYTDQYGDTSFVTPLVGRAAALPLNLWSKLTTGNWAGVSDVPMQSPASSLNLALGADSIFPGIGPVAALPLSQGILPDNAFTNGLRQSFLPFGERGLLQSTVPPWLSKIIAGTGSLPYFGDAIGGFVDGLSPSNKNKHLRDAMMILASSGNYPNWATDDMVFNELQQDAKGLAQALLITTGLIQNFSPTTPYPQTTVNLFGDGYKGNLEDETSTSYAIGMMNSLFQQYRTRNAGDETAAREEFVRDFGPAAIFATIGDWKNFSRQPTSQALDFAQAHPAIAEANLDLFSLFFPQGDPSDVAAVMWMNKHGKAPRERKNASEIASEVVKFLEQSQRSRIDFMEGNGLISSDQAEIFREEVKQRYLETGDVTGTYVDKTREMEKLHSFVSDYSEISGTQAGRAFISAWNARTVALEEARKLTGRPNAGLGGKDVASIRIWFNSKIQQIADANPDFILLANKFRREWD